MATRSVRFEFICENTSNKLVFHHNIPSYLITVESQYLQQSPAYVNSFLNAITLIMKEHETDCRQASDPHCGKCGSPTVRILQTPMSFLHHVDEPFVSVFVHPICEKEKCETHTRQEIQNIMAEVVQESHTNCSWGPEEILYCKICGRREGLKRCGRCKVVAYCGRDHQKADWKLHRKACAPKEQ